MNSETDDEEESAVEEMNQAGNGGDNASNSNESVARDDGDNAGNNNINEAGGNGDDGGDDDGDDDGGDDEIIEDDAENAMPAHGGLDFFGQLIEQINGPDDDDDDDFSGSNVDVTSEEDSEEEDGSTTYDTNLPTSHSYLGDDLEILHGRTIHGDDDIVTLPLYHVARVVVVPGQVLCLNIVHPTFIAMIKRVVEADKTFGLQFLKPGPGLHEESDQFASIGVTMEIISLKEEDAVGLRQIKLKAEGRQRFKILSRKFQLDGVLLGKVRILPEARIPCQPREALVCSQHYPQCNSIRGQLVSNRFRLNHEKLSSSEQRYLVGFNLKHAHILCSSLTSIQGWTYRLYNPYFLMDCLLQEIRSWNQNLDFEDMPQNPIGFSYWITKNLPLTNAMRIELLEIDSAPLRLRKQLEFMNKFGTSLNCEQCDTTITDKNEIFSLSKRGPVGAFVNPGGYVHETVTFHKATNLRLQGTPTAEYSWFPGYAWTICLCKTCHHHMGWKFTAVKKDLKPKKFWGLTRAALKPVFKQNPNEMKAEDEERPSSTTARATRHESEASVNSIQYDSSI